MLQTFHIAFFRVLYNTVSSTSKVIIFTLPHIESPVFTII